MLITPTPTVCAAYVHTDSASVIASIWIDARPEDLAGKFCAPLVVSHDPNGSSELVLLFDETALWLDLPPAIFETVRSTDEPLLVLAVGCGRPPAHPEEAPATRAQLVIVGSRAEFVEDLDHLLASTSVVGTVETITDRDAGGIR